MLLMFVLFPTLVVPLTFFLIFQYRATTLPAFKYYVTCACLIFFCIFIVQILVLPKYVCFISKYIEGKTLLLTFIYFIYLFIFEDINVVN